MKPNIFLDLDDTCIYSIDYKDFNKYKKYTKYKNYNMLDKYIIFERPYLQYFLDFLFKKFNVSIWTAASKNYALFIIEHIIIKDKPERNIDWIFFSYHSIISKKYTNYIKCLDIIWDKCNIIMDKNNTFIIDDNKEVYNAQPKFCILVKKFNIKNSNKKDKCLYNLIQKLKNIK